jgi:hypothetical protein
LRNEFIKKANVIPHPSHLDDCVYDGRFLSIIGSNVKAIDKYINLPVRDLIGLYKPDDYIDYKTWRQAVEGLRCDDWDEHEEAILKYFEGDVGNTIFPTPSSGGHLRINFVGGAGYCGIGNNRLVATKIHLTHKFGELAYLNNAWCNYKPIHPELAKVLSSAVSDKAHIYFSESNPGLATKHPNPGYFKGVIQIDRGGNQIEFYLVFSNVLSRVAKKDSWLDIVLNRRVFKPCQLIKYTPVSHKLVEKVFELSKVSRWFPVK